MRVGFRGGMLSAPPKGEDAAPDQEAAGGVTGCQSVMAALYSSEAVVTGGSPGATGATTAVARVRRVRGCGPGRW
jgi:hypothetical protein